MTTPDPHEQPGPGVEEEIQLQTVNHPIRTSIAWALFSALVLLLAFLVTR